ncbi:hypothetical protein SJAV_02850 [Sulfurisphaera javensis]|uniref:Uncharacterized protein n=1 Tax=Sulfurisphaera javensis TaxID=2049879 RepID=A0AAT9GNA7_9CREN
MENNIVVKKSREEVMRVIVDPFRLFGIISHINILQVYDEEKNIYTTLDKVNVFPRKFRVMYIFGTPDTKITTFLGYMEGPKIVPGGVRYQGRDNEETFYWDLEIYVKERQEGSSLSFHMNTIYKPKITHKLLGKEVKELKEEFNFPDHILKAHLIPYFKFYGFIDDTLLSQEQ